MDNERTADVLQVALASYDRKELRVQKNYLEEQNPVLACTCFLNGHKLLQELQQGHNFDIVVLCSQMEDMSSIEFMMELRKLEHKPLLMLFDEGRRKNSSALRMEDSGSCCCVERMELKNLLRELYRMPGQQWQRTEQQCQQLYHSWGIRIPDINCSYLTSAVGVVYGTSQKLAIRKEILQAVSEQYGVSVSAVDSGIRRMIDQLENRRSFLGGAQLGLLLCRECCRRMGWGLSVECAPEKGTQAVVTVPLYTDDGRAPEVELHAGADLASEQHQYQLRAMLVRELRTMPERGDPDE